MVEEPDSFRVVPERMGTTVHIKVIVPEEEMGRVIGRQGRTAAALRTLVGTAADLEGVKATLEFRDDA